MLAAPWFHMGVMKPWMLRPRPQKNMRARDHRHRWPGRVPRIRHTPAIQPVQRHRWNGSDSFRSHWAGRRRHTVAKACQARMLHPSAAAKRGSRRPWSWRSRAASCRPRRHAAVITTTQAPTTVAWNAEPASKWCIQACPDMARAYDNPAPVASGGGRCSWRNWPQAAAMSLPRLARMWQLTPRSRSTRWKVSTSGVWGRSNGRPLTSL